MKSAPISDAIRSLSELRSMFDEIEQIEATLTERRDELAATDNLVAAKTDELEKLKAGLSVTQLRNLKEHDEAIFAKRKEFESLSVQTAAKQRELDEATAKANAAAQRHRDIEASIESMKRKHFG